MHHQPNNTLWVLLAVVAALALFLLSNPKQGLNPLRAWMESNPTAPSAQQQHMDGMGMMQSPTQTDDDIASDPGDEDAVLVEIQDFKYAPSRITIKVGETVSWINRDGVGHNVVFENTGEAGQMMAQGESWSYQFTRTGNLDYFCAPHPFMIGRVVVED
jgi:amicyanin